MFCLIVNLNIYTDGASVLCARVCGPTHTQSMENIKYSVVYFFQQQKTQQFINQLQISSFNWQKLPFSSLRVTTLKHLYLITKAQNVW